MRRKPYTLDRMLKDYMSFFEQFGMDEDNIRSHFITWSKDRPPLVTDYTWYLFNQLLAESAKQCKTEYELYDNLRKIYFQMLYFRRKTEKKKANEILRLFLEADIRRTLASMDLKVKVVVIAGHCCPYCDAMHNQEFEPDDVLEHQYLGSEKCTNERGCNCCYSFRPIRDSRGRLVTR